MAPYRETAQCLHLKRERMSEYLMKWKKWIALALSAVMAVSMLTACGGSGGVSGSLNVSKMTDLLEDAGSDAVIVRENKLSTAVTAAAKNVASSGATGSASRIVAENMGWTVTNVLGELINDIKNSGAIMSIGTSVGITYVVEENDLKTNTGLGLLGYLASNREQIQKLGAINTPEAFAAAQILMIDGALGTVQDISGNAVRFSYNAAAKKATTSSDTSYWVIAIEVKASAL